MRELRRKEDIVVLSQNYKVMTMDCAIYARVSKGEQDTEHQVDTLKKYAFQQNYNVYKVYVDEITGTADSRPALNQLMFDSRKGCFQVVLIWKLDRLGRSLQHLLRIAEEWQKRGVGFVSITQGFDTTTASGKLIFQILGAMAEFEHSLISERTKLGLKGKVNVGKRGKDHKPRKKSGYLLRYASKKVREKYGPPSF
jgi:DNA invertase Pin-like site-specific DNA recombinase